MNVQKIEKTAFKDLDESTKQDLTRNIIDKEVYYCVSHLISHLAQTEIDECGEYYDDIMNVCQAYDYETPSIYALENDWDRAELIEYLEDEGIEGYNNTSNKTLAAAIVATITYDEEWAEFASSYSIEPEIVEAYEHWLVSEWFARKLAERGEMVSMDIHGLTVWGRCTTGQAILLDSVVQSIYAEIHDE